MSRDDWDRRLDRFEETLGRVDTALLRGEAPEVGPRFATEAPDAVASSDQRRRAAALLERAARCEARVREELEDELRSLEAMRARRRAARSYGERVVNTSTRTDA